MVLVGSAQQLKEGKQPSPHVPKREGYVRCRSRDRRRLFDVQGSQDVETVPVTEGIEGFRV
jgi:hypothetical protein